MPSDLDDLKSIVAGIDGFAGWNYADKIRFFAWFQHAVKGKERFSTSDISACFDAFHYDKPNISQFLRDMAGRRPKVFLPKSTGYYALEGKLRADFDQKYGTHEITLNIRQQVKDLINQVPDIAERDFMKEAEVCLRHDAGRGTIIMVWCVGFYHLCQYVMKHKLAEFNAGFQKHYPGLWKDARVKAMTNYDDFLTLREFVVIDGCKREQIINQNVAKILHEKLDKRNSAAHPSTVHIGQLQAENFIDELVKNVILALQI